MNLLYWSYQETHKLFARLSIPRNKSSMAMAGAQEKDRAAPRSRVVHMPPSHVHQVHRILKPSSEGLSLLPYSVIKRVSGINIANARNGRK